jgi:hypothetical protein
MIVLDQYDKFYQLMDYETDESEDFMSCCDVNEHEAQMMQMISCRVVDRSSMKATFMTGTNRMLVKMMNQRRRCDSD